MSGLGLGLGLRLEIGLYCQDARGDLNARVRVRVKARVRVEARDRAESPGYKRRSECDGPLHNLLLLKTRLFLETCTTHTAEHSPGCNRRSGQGEGGDEGQ